MNFSHTAYIALGSNVGNREDRLLQATSLLSMIESQLLAESPIYESQALLKTGQPKQNRYLNQVIKISTSLSPTDLLELSQLIESKLGRTKKGDWSPRTIDIDLLLYNNEVIDTQTLNIPHPELHNRRFVLQPLSDIAPELMHPLLHSSVLNLLDNCPDTNQVTVFNP